MLNSRGSPWSVRWFPVTEAKLLSMSNISAPGESLYTHCTERYTSFLSIFSLTPLTLRNIVRAICTLIVSCLNVLLILSTVTPPAGPEIKVEKPESELVVKEDNGERDIAMHLATVGVVGILGIIIGRVAFKPQ
jgi:hypothetical protein